MMTVLLVFRFGLTALLTMPTTVPMHTTVANLKVANPDLLDIEILRVTE